MTTTTATVQQRHAPNTSLYLAIFGALMFLTVLTVLVSYLQLPKGPAVLIALAIAMVKASLVAAVFMHLKGEKVVIFIFLGITLFFMGLLFLLPISDTLFTHDRRIPFDWKESSETHVP